MPEQKLMCYYMFSEEEAGTRKVGVRKEKRENQPYSDIELGAVWYQRPLVFSLTNCLLKLQLCLWAVGVVVEKEEDFSPWLWSPVG